MGCLGKNPFPFLPEGGHLLEVTCISWLMVLHHSALCFLLAPPPSSAYEDTCEYTRPTCIIQGTVPVSRFLIQSHLQSPFFVM